MLPRGRMGARFAWKIGIAVGIGSVANGASAQRDVRINLHPIKSQVGIVTRMAGKAAWIRLPQPVPEGTKVEFLPYSDGGDVLAVGKVSWVATAAPYEAYVTEIKATKTRHELNDYDSLFSTEALFKETRIYGPRPTSDQYSVDLGAGFFARTPILSPPSAHQDSEPVTANIRALRALKTRTALSIADAAARALKEDASDEPPDYALLRERLQPFHRLTISDPITEHLLQRLLDLCDKNEEVVSIPVNILRPPMAPTGGGQPTGP